MRPNSPCDKEYSALISPAKRAMKKVCPNDEKKVSKNPPKIQRRLFLRKIKRLKTRRPYAIRP
jgi:hypothetical protein